MSTNKKIHFEVSERKILLRFFDVFFVVFALYLVGLIFKFNYFHISKANFIWTLVLGAYINIFGTVFEMYNLQTASNQYQIIKSILLTATTTVLFFLLTPILTPFLPSNRLQIFYFFVAITVSLFAWRLFYQRFLGANRFVKKVVMVCDRSQLKELAKALEKADPHYKILAYVNSDDKGKTDSVRDIIDLPVASLEDFVRNNGISEVVIASRKKEAITVEVYNALLKLLENGFIIREYTQVYEDVTQRIPVQYVDKDFYRYFPFSRSNHNKLYLVLVRGIEIAFSLSGIIFGLCILPLVLFGNLIGNRGKLFYTQERVGKNGIPFKIFKFRTMVKNAETGNAVFATQNDARITPFGKFLRKSRLDEFPQFINILKGDMAVIGPRPERPFFVDQIAKEMPFYQTRHVIKPGLTGWAQVNYSYGDSIKDSLIKLQYDLYYIKHRSVSLDINITIKTVSTILFYRGQ